MGGKILWQLFSNKQHPVSQLLWKKYLHDGSLKNIQMENTIKGSIIWNSFRKVLDLFVQHLYRIPGNGRKTFMWEDRINGHDPLHADDAMAEIQNWLTNKGIHRLADIASWDDKGNWINWSLPLMTERGLPNLSDH